MERQGEEMMEEERLREIEEERDEDEKYDYHPVPKT